MPSSPRASISVSSPLSPNFSMTPIVAPSPPTLKGRHRGHSISVAALARRASDIVAPPLSRVASSCSRALHPNAEAEEFTTSFRSRGPATAPDSSALSTWWSGNELIPRPWTDPPKSKKTVPSEQTEGWIQTREVFELTCCRPLCTHFSTCSVSLKLLHPFSVLPPTLAMKR